MPPLWVRLPHVSSCGTSFCLPSGSLQSKKENEGQRLHMIAACSHLLGWMAEEKSKEAKGREGRKDRACGGLSSVLGPCMQTVSVSSLHMLSFMKASVQTLHVCTWDSLCTLWSTFYIPQNKNQPLTATETLLLCCTWYSARCTEFLLGSHTLIK